MLGIARAERNKRDLKSIINKKDILEKFGENAEIGASRLAILSKTSKETGIGISNLITLSKDVNNSFRMWGDQSNATISILGRRLVVMAA